MNMGKSKRRLFLAGHRSRDHVEVIVLCLERAAGSSFAQRHEGENPKSLIVIFF